MTTITCLAEAYKAIFVEEAEALARPSGYTQRHSKLTASKAAQILTFGWQQNPAASLSELAQVAAVLGVDITPQGLAARFTERTATFLRQLLERALQMLTPIRGEDKLALPLLARFTGVYLLDSTVLPLPAIHHTTWPGHGNNRSEPTAGIRVQVRLDFRQGWIDHLTLQPARAQDRTAPAQQAPRPPGSLRLADLGYYTLPVFRTYDAAGVYYISRLRAETQVMTTRGAPMSALELVTQHGGQGVIDLPIYLGKAEELPCRLVAWPVPPAVAAKRRARLRDHARKQQRPVNPISMALAAWTIFVTNVPATLLTPAEIEFFARLRWQIELLFKRWKSLGKLTVSTSENPWRILCEVYAKLLGLLCQHWLLMATAWTLPDRSFWNATISLRIFALPLAQALSHVPALVDIILLIKTALAHTATVTKRRKRPAMHQLFV